MISPLTRRFTRGLPSSTKSTGYPKNWAARSEAFRRMRGYKCHACGVCCAKQEHHRLLDVHHINGVKSDCKDNNLRCLCKECHAKQPLHGHYAAVVGGEDKETLRQLRQEQGLPAL